MLGISFSLEVISRSQLPQNSKIWCRCFGRRLLQNQHENGWNISVCVVLVSPYSVQELLSPNCMRRYLFVIRKPQACLKFKKHETASLCYGFFSVVTEYVRQYQEFGPTHLLAKSFGEGLVPSRDLRDWCIFMRRQSVLFMLDKLC